MEEVTEAMVDAIFASETQLTVKKMSAADGKRQCVGLAVDANGTDYYFGAVVTRAVEYVIGIGAAPGQMSYAVQVIDGSFRVFGLDGALLLEKKLIKQKE